MILAKHLIFWFVLICTGLMAHVAEQRAWIAPLFQPDSLSRPEPDTLAVTLVLVGDVMGHGPQIQAAWHEASKSHVYDSCWAWLRPWIEPADWAIANLEVTLAGPPYSGYPQFSSPDELAFSLQRAGFDALVTANNHTMDRGGKGMVRTLDMLDSIGLLHTGSFRDTAERLRQSPLLLAKNGIRIALINATYGTNGIPVPSPHIVHSLDTLLLGEELAKADSLKADFTLVFVHWGSEYQRQESEEQRLLADWLRRRGADAVIGAHPHVIQPVRSDSTGLVCYSLGNFISNQRERYKDGGLLYGLTLQKIGNAPAYIAAHGHLPVWVHKSPLRSPNQYRLIPVFDWEKNPQAFGLSKADSLKISQFGQDTRELLPGIPQWTLRR